MIHVFVLVLIIVAEIQSDTCEEALCFRSVLTCNWYSNKLTRGRSPSTQQVSAFCKPVLVDPEQPNIRIYD